MCGQGRKANLMPTIALWHTECIDLHSPMSPILILSDRVTNTFWGLMSRCRIRRACKYSRPWSQEGSIAAWFCVTRVVENFVDKNHQTKLANKTENRKRKGKTKTKTNANNVKDESHQTKFWH